MTKAEWTAIGIKRFGADQMKWKFKCPACGHVASAQDYKNAGAPATTVAFSCIGRYLQDKPREAFAKKGEGPCNYAGGGLFGLNPIEVDGEHYFEFAEND